MSAIVSVPFAFATLAGPNWGSPQVYEDRFLMVPMDMSIQMLHLTWNMAASSAFPAHVSCSLVQVDDRGVATITGRGTDFTEASLGVKTLDAQFERLRFGKPLYLRIVMECSDGGSGTDPWYLTNALQLCGTLHLLTTPVSPTR